MWWVLIPIILIAVAAVTSVWWAQNFYEDFHD